MAAVYNGLSLAGCDALLDHIDGVLTGQGWTKFEMDGRTGQGSVSGGFRKERVYRINGTASDPAKTYVGIARETNTTNGIRFWSAAAMRGFPLVGGVVLPDVSIPVTNAVIASNILTITTGIAHGMAVGDRPFYAGGNDAFTSQQTATAVIGTGGLGPPIATVPSGTTLTVTGMSSNMSAISGGYLLQPFFPGGERFASSNGTGIRANVSDALMSLYYYCDEFRFSGFILQGGVGHIFGFGESARKHIPDGQADRAMVSGAPTGTGAQVVTLSRNCPNIINGQYVAFVHPNAEISERVLVTSKPAANQVGVTLANSYPVGAMVGEDPCPVYVLGASGSSGQQTLAARAVRFSMYHTGVRSGTVPSGQMHTYTPSAFSEIVGTSDPDDLGFYGIRDIVAYRTSSPKGQRGPLVGFQATGLGGNDLDLIYNGAITGVPADAFKYFATAGFDANRSFGIGPGAT